MIKKILFLMTFTLQLLFCNNVSICMDNGTGPVKKSPFTVEGVGANKKVPPIKKPVVLNSIDIKQRQLQMDEFKLKQSMSLGTKAIEVTRDDKKLAISSLEKDTKDVIGKIKLLNLPQSESEKRAILEKRKMIMEASNADLKKQKIQVNDVSQKFTKNMNFVFPISVALVIVGSYGLYTNYVKQKNKKTLHIK